MTTYIQLHELYILNYVIVILIEQFLIDEGKIFELNDYRTCCPKRDICLSTSDMNFTGEIFHGLLDNKKCLL
jgi:hypothetical protein